MNVLLTPELETLVDQKVKAGLYDSPSEVITEALRLLDYQDRMNELKREDLRREVMRGIEDLRAGRYVTLETEEDFKAHAELTIQRGEKILENRRNDKHPSVKS